MTQRQQKAKVYQSLVSEGPKNPKTSQILANTLIEKTNEFLINHLQRNYAE